MPRLLTLSVIFPASLDSSQASTGAAIPWITYEAEDMVHTGAVLEFTNSPIGWESSAGKCVKLAAPGHFVEFSARAAANALVVRYSLPDPAEGRGVDATISLYQNSTLIRKLPITSRYSWLYGSYPFVNSPAAGSARNCYDEVRLKDVPIRKGDVLRLQRDKDGGTLDCCIDLVDLEQIPPPRTAPTNAVSLADFDVDNTGTKDATAALRKCLATAASRGSVAWLPAGTFLVSGTIDLPANVTLQGAGMWHTTLIGDPVQYTNAARRVTLNGLGSNIHLADFAIVGRLDYRNDSEPNDGLGGAYGEGSSISRVWVEHTKAGAWIFNSHGLVVQDCRFRNTIADGLNFCVGMRGCTVTNCTARGTGDDCFAIWPATFLPQKYVPGLNRIIHCTGQTPFLANGVAIYGGESNQVEDCHFQDLSYGCGILISTTFPVGNNHFSGATRIQRCDLRRCGGRDHTWGWRAAAQLCLDRQSLAGVQFTDLNLESNLSDGLSVIASGSHPQTGPGTLSQAAFSQVRIPDFGLAVGGRHGLWISPEARGSAVITQSSISEYRNDSTNFILNFKPGK